MFRGQILGNLDILFSFLKSGYKDIHTGLDYMFISFSVSE